MASIPSLGIPTTTKSLNETLGFNPQVTQVSFRRPVTFAPLISSNTERSSPRFLPVHLRKGSEVPVEALEQEGVKDVFTSTGGESMEIIREALLNIIRIHKGGILAEYAIQDLDELMNGPRQWLTSGGLGLMGFGLPAAIGAAVARPDSAVVAIDDDGCFVMNVQELAIDHSG